MNYTFIHLENNKKVAVTYEKTVKNQPLLKFLQAGC